MYSLMISGLNMFEKMLSMSVSLPLKFSLVWSVMVGRKWFEVRMGGWEDGGDGRMGGWEDGRIGRWEDRRMGE